MHREEGTIATQVYVRATRSKMSRGSGGDRHETHDLPGSGIVFIFPFHGSDLVSSPCDSLKCPLNSFYDKCAKYSAERPTPK